MVDDRNPHPIDVHVGGRVRLRRTMLRISQEVLGKELGVTFQQVQKYEKGTNRISASKLYEICQALSVQVSFFFEGISVGTSRVAGLAEADGAAYKADFLSTSESVKLNLAFQRIDNPALRRQIVDLAKTVADETGQPEEQRLS
ncbi:MAG: helix-turn-helix domain-containing protein [Rhizobiaceae bacterium]